MKRYYLGDEFPGIYLTERQAQCMAHFILGCSNRKVATLLDLSPRTIDAYTVDLKKKLGCYFKSQLVEKIKQTPFMEAVPGLLHPCAESLLEEEASITDVCDAESIEEG